VCLILIVSWLNNSEDIRINPKVKIMFFIPINS
jgi:hypothetical protein